MAIRKTVKKRSPAEIKRLIGIIEAEIETQKSAREKSGMAFSSPTRAQLEAKLQRAESPLIYFGSWTASAPLGGTIAYAAGLFNPDPVQWDNLAVAVTVGNRNAITSNDLFLSAFDTRFPTLAAGAPFGFSLLSLKFASADFVVTIPMGVDKTSYFGNAVLQQLNFSDAGKYLDRGAFFFDVV